MTTKASFLLLADAWHGAWCWQHIIPLLERAGHPASAPDLPGLGLDQTPLAEATLQRSLECITDLVMRASSPIILVGHGFSGGVLTQLAEQCAEQIAQLVYLAAIIPHSGENMLEALAASGQAGFAGMEQTRQGLHLHLDEVPERFYYDCPRADVRLALKHLRVQALQPLQTPITLSHRSQGMPCTYISCTEDRVLNPAAQRYYAAMCGQVLTLPGGHSPFFSVPELLTTYLLALAGTEQPGIWEVVV